MASASSQFLFQTNHSSASLFPKELLKIKDMRSPVLGSRKASSTGESDQSRRLRTPGKTVSRSLKGFDQHEFKSYLSGLKSISGQQNEGRQQRDSNKPIDWEKLMENEEDLDIKSVENDDANYFLKPTHSNTSGVTTVLHKPEEKGGTSDGDGTTKTQKLIQDDRADTKEMTSISPTHTNKTTGRTTTAPASTKERKDEFSQTSTEISKVESSELDSSFSGPKIRQHFYTISDLDTDLSLTPKLSIREEMVVEKLLSDDQNLKSSNGDGRSLSLLSTGVTLVHSKFDAAGPSRMTASEKPFQFSAKSQFDDNDDLASPSTSSPASARDPEEDSTGIQESILEEVLEDTEDSKDIQESIISEDTEGNKDIQESILEEIFGESSLIITEENRDKEVSMVTTEDNMEYQHAGILGESSAYTLHGESSFESESDQTLSICIIAKMSGSGMSSEGTPSYTLDFSNGDDYTGSHTKGRSRSGAASSLNKISRPPKPKPTKIPPAYPTTELTTYTPNMLALNDMLRSQLRLTRQLLTTHRSLLTSLTSSLRQDYHYTTLQDTKHFIRIHKPKVLTLSEAKSKSRHKQDS